MKQLHAAVVAKQAAAATLSSYLPQRVAEKLARGEVEREELEVTVLFSDIRGFSRWPNAWRPTRSPRSSAGTCSAMAEIIVKPTGMIEQVPR